MKLQPQTEREARTLMRGVYIIPISKEYREGYERIRWNKDKEPCPCCKGPLEYDFNEDAYFCYSCRIGINREDYDQDTKKSD